MSGKTMKEFVTLGIAEKLKDCRFVITTDLFTDDERLEFIAMLAEGICTSCGRVLGFKEVCCCENDE